MAEEKHDEKNNLTVSIVSKADKENTNKLTVVPQILAVTVKNLLVLPTGMTIGFITILIPRIVGNDPNEHFSLTPEQISWIGSSLSISSFIGSLGSGFISQPLGRKRVMILTTIPFFLAWIIHRFATEIWHLFFALSLNGICGGLVGGSVFSYVAEISQPHVRGMLSATSSVTIVFGVSVEIYLGTFLPWRTAALFSAIVPIIAFCLLWFLPESPQWLLSKHRDEEAKKSLAWFRGWTTTDSVEKEFQQIKDNSKKKQIQSNSVKKLTKTKKLQVFLSKSFLFPLCLISFIYALGNFTGGLTLQTYSVLIFATLDVPINKYYATVLMGSFELIGCLLSIVLVRCLGKRKMGLFSLFAVILCDIFIGVYAFMNNINKLNYKTDFENISLDSISGHQWIPLFLLLSISFVGHCGLKGLPWILVGEVFSYETRSFGCGLCTAVFFITAFLANKVFLDMVNGLSFPGVYWFYAGVGCVGFIIIYMAVPETEGKTLQEINDHFAGRNKLDNNKLLKLKEEQLLTSA
ncbi:hypothetical protein RN001_008722 [Aquatica leii]|uniref:Major facilitator superfamily (MFS) profile domain-containing protein n=1 Tax=Aquatica leii TaxID=1421715 RepID=A0AAN7S9U0_9COLE|nr:hypothetical protein RN001_008722 [Aquatica leii]